MSTPEQEYEAAVEMVARRLAGIQTIDKDIADKLWARMEQVHWLAEARAILSLTWPSGQPVIGVLAKDQSFRALTALMPPERKIGFDLAMGEMKEAGFRRVVEKR